ncbi:hypothetical protein [Laspinema olomoucense]|uniref:hypothetical protein n=1 Tax=Laspinema olomoucense TaxID=3231600 RepID=UPI0021BA9BD5|nr:hypothetical protein [Laspinema sp. D3c]MCT7994827.1 hypothetical protein [Laspinema sp. D3c]
MITTLNLNRHRKAKIWLGELPNLINPEHGCLECSLPGRTSTLTNRQQGAIEMLVPSAGRALYGLLGGEFFPTDSGELIVKVAVSENTEIEMPGSLASNLDTVYRGLPVEYADSVFNGIGDAGEILGSGILFCNCAAHSPVGSSPRMFRQIALILVRLIASQTASVSEEEFTEEELTRLVSAG